MNKETSIIGGIAALAIVVVGALVIMGGGKGSTTNEPQVDAGKLVHADSYKIGTGTVTLVEFGDFQCPACGQAAPTIEKLIQDYQGKITVVFRHFPLPQHKNALAAAEAAEAVGAQGKFWEMYASLYANQAEWSESDKAADFFVKYAATLGVDGAKVKTAIDTKQYESKINADSAEGTSIGVNATPTIYVNGHKTKDYSYATLKAAIEKELK